MGAHLIDGQFQSDKYPTCPRNKVPLSVRDRDAQDLLWEYAQRHKGIDAEFSADLETALREAGYNPTKTFEVEWAAEEGYHLILEDGVVIARSRSRRQANRIMGLLTRICPHDIDDEVDDPGVPP